MDWAASRALSLLALLALAFVLALPALAADAATLRGYWRPVQQGDSAASVAQLPESRAGQAFDPDRLHVFPREPRGVWILLWPDHGAVAPGAQSVLTIDEPSLQTVSWFPRDAAPVLGAGLFVPARGWQGHGRIGFVLDAAQVASSPLVLRLEPGHSVAPPLRFSLLDGTAFGQRDARWLAVASACLAIMLAMAVMALLFAAELREIAFVWYAIYVVTYALILTVQYGFVTQPLGWSWVAEQPGVWGRLFTAASVLSATLFVARFADLRRFAPRLRVAVLAIGVATAVAMGLGSLSIPWLTRLAAIAINPLLILGGPVILVASVVAAWRGSRYALFFLIGWTPLLTITVFGSLQVFGFFAEWTWLGEASFIGGAVEAVVLSLGLADRSLALRHDRDIARAQAETDALTGVFNRRGLQRRMDKLVAGAHRRRQPLSVLFLDLDRFKRLNDVQGHAAGDAALVALARLMRADMRSHDVLGRFGGEEFLAVLPDCDASAAWATAQRVCADLKAMCIPVTQADDALTVSVGVATVGDAEATAALVARADAAMYAAKRAGGDRAAQAEPAHA